jgi:hypothetical protein
VTGFTEAERRKRPGEPAVADVIGWLRSPAGERWSARRHAGTDTMPWHQPPTLWRATGPLDARQDPCGGMPVRAGSRAGAGNARGGGECR